MNAYLAFPELLGLGVRFLPWGPWKALRLATIGPEHWMFRGPRQCGKRVEMVQHDGPVLSDRNWVGRLSGAGEAAGFFGIWIILFRNQSDIYNCAEYSIPSTAPLWNKPGFEKLHKKLFPTGPLRKFMVGICVSNLGDAFRSVLE